MAEALAEISRQPLLFLRAASIHAQIEHWASAERLLKVGIARYPEAVELQNAYREIAGQNGRPAPAIAGAIDEGAALLPTQPMKAGL